MNTPPEPDTDGPNARPTVDALIVAGQRVYWIEGRPDGDTLVVWNDGHAREVLPAGTHVASTVHEYGGGAYTVFQGEVWFVRADDQQIWRTFDGNLARVTSRPPIGEHRYGDLQISSTGLLVCVRERHERGRVVNELVAMPADGSAHPVVIADGAEFYSSPRTSPAGTRLAWLTWRAPLMPWDGTWLWIADIYPDRTLGPVSLVAGGTEESVSQPRWSPQGTLHFLTDRGGWWNLHRCRDPSPVRGEPVNTESVVIVEAELGPAAWEFGYTSYTFLTNGQIATTVQQGPRTWLAVTAGGAELKRIALPYNSIKPYLAAAGNQLAIIGSNQFQAPTVALIDPDTAESAELIASSSARPATADIAACELIDFRTRDGAHAHAVWYPPPYEAGSRWAIPPLLVRAHPGPTANTQLRLDPWVAFFTSHGFAVLDLDYRGSTGYGRAYRNALRGRWGELDVTDCVDAVEHLTATGRADATRVAICGSSAGGYTALRAITTTSVFAAATVRHAVIDPATWRHSAPKFQAHHSTLLIGPPSDDEIYARRSVLSHAATITTPVMLIHGEKDTITPVTQARELANMLGARATLLTFAEEGHGLRNPHNVSAALSAELRHLRQNLT